jgi:methionyl-tRNA synthetase
MIYPKKAVVTAGMPYGNKYLHYGHIGGVFIHADITTRFLKSKIGDENVLFVSGTDCYGSPIEVGFEKQSEYKTIEEYVMHFHEVQKQQLDLFDIKLSVYATSAFGKTGEIHKEMSQDIFNKLYSNGTLLKVTSEVFYDELSDKYLNGRQVYGKCPIDNCTSVVAYAEECAYGHQFSPKELINPKSVVSDDVPTLKKVDNWVFDLEKYHDFLKEYYQEFPNHRKFASKVIDEYMKKPLIYVKKSDYDIYLEIADKFKHELLEDTKNSFTLSFDRIADREFAVTLLKKHKVQFRTGKALVPLRISGNLKWGIPIPNSESTFWVWPESLWAPLSFTKSLVGEGWKDFWFNEDTSMYQWIGEDNLYFYSLAAFGLFKDLYNPIKYPNIVANRHIQYKNNKISSSSLNKKIELSVLLNHYTLEQLRYFFYSLNLSKKNANVSFSHIDGDTKSDEIILQANVLTNTYNRVLRTFFYSTHEYFDGYVPDVEVDLEIKKMIESASQKYEKNMMNQDFHLAAYVIDKQIRFLSKYLSKHMSDDELRAKALSNALYMILEINEWLKPVTPKVAGLVDEKINIESRKVEVLPDKFDFYPKHESQYKR